MVQSWFTPEKVQSMRPYIDKTVNDLLDRMKAKGCADGPVDFVEEFALPVPSYVLCSLPSTPVKRAMRPRS